MLSIRKATKKVFSGLALRKKNFFGTLKKSKKTTGQLKKNDFFASSLTYYAYFRTFFLSKHNVGQTINLFHECARQTVQPSDTETIGRDQVFKLMRSWLQPFWRRMSRARIPVNINIYICEEIFMFSHGKHFTW